MSDEILVEKNGKLWKELKEDLSKPSHWWVEAYYSIYRLILKIEDFPKEIKWLFQRAKRGYADCDVWNLSHYLSSVIAGSVKRLKKIQHGLPTVIFTEGKLEEQARKEWNYILDGIITAFESLRDIDEFSDTELFDAGKTPEAMGKIEENAQEGMQLFVKYFRDLWD